MKFFIKQKYSKTNGIDLSSGKTTSNAYIEKGVKYVLFNFIKWKWVTNKIKL